jgi:hypothetical protein
MNRMGDFTDSALARAEVPRVRTPKFDRPIQGKSTISEVFSDHLDALEAKAAVLANEAEPPSDAEKAFGAEKEGAADEVESASRVNDAAEMGLVARRFSHLFEIGVKNDRAAEQSLEADADESVLTRPTANGSETRPAVPLRIDRAPISFGASPLKAADNNSATERRPAWTNGRLSTPTDVALANGITLETAQTGLDRTSTLSQTQLATNATPRHQPAQPVSHQPTASDGAKPVLNSADMQPLDRLITVVRQETHAPPAVHLSPTAQVANALITGIEAPETSRLAQSAGEPMPTLPTTSGVVRVLQIELEPPELGTVSIRLKLESQALELRISADQAGTADLIRRDQSVLTRLLQSAGYNVETLSVYVAEPDRSTMSSGQSAQQGSQGTPQQTTSYTSSGGGQPEERSGENHRPIRQDRAEGSVTAESSNDRPSVGASDRISIYV